MSRSVGLNHKISLFLKETLAGTLWLYKVIILFYNTTLKMLRNDQSLWEGIMFFLICGISSSCHSYSTATWNSCSTVQKQRQRICWSLSQAITEYLSRESSLNWMDPMYILTTDSGFVGTVFGAIKVFYYNSTRADRGPMKLYKLCFSQFSVREFRGKQFWKSWKRKKAYFLELWDPVNAKTEETLDYTKTFLSSLCTAVLVRTMLPFLFC